MLTLDAKPHWASSNIVGGQQRKARELPAHTLFHPNSRAARIYGDAASAVMRATAVGNEHTAAAVSGREQTGWEEAEPLIP